MLQCPLGNLLLCKRRETLQVTSDDVSLITLWSRVAPTHRPVMLVTFTPHPEHRAPTGPRYNDKTFVHRVSLTAATCVVVYRVDYRTV